MEKGDNEDDSDAVPLLRSVSSFLPFDSITQPVLQPDKHDSHPSLSLRPGGPTPKQKPSHLTQQAVTKVKLNTQHCRETVLFIKVLNKSHFNTG